MSWFLVSVLLAVLIATSSAQKPHQRSLLIVFDGTGSMNSSLQELKPAAARIVSEFASRADKPIHNYVLTVFNDPWVEPTLDTTDPQELLAALAKINVFTDYNVNKDFSEKAITGIKQSLPRALRNSIVFVITDAGANDYDLEEEVKQVLMKKQITVNFLLSDDKVHNKSWCSVDEIASEKECTVYQNLVRASGGKLFNMTENELGNVIRHLERTLDPKHILLIQRISESAGKQQELINVDQSIQEVCASITGENATLEALGPDLKKLVLVSQIAMKNYKFGCIKDPATSQFTFDFSADSPFTVSIDARSSLTFDFGFSIRPVQQHSETNFEPLAGHKNILTIFPSDSTLVGSLSSVTLVTVPSNPHEKPQSINYPLKKVNDGAYATEPFTIPSQPFYISLTGVDSIGLAITRDISSPLTSFEASKPEVSVDSLNLELCVNEQVEMICRVKSQVYVTAAWTFNGQILKEGSANQSLELPLSLTNLEVAQKGLYKCEAQNVIGTKSQDASLSVLKIPKVNIITATTELAEYRRYALECEITNTDSQPTIQWIDHDKMILLTGSSTYTYTALRQDNGKSITCEARNKKCIASDTKILQINHLPSFKDRNTDPIVYKTLNYGESVELNCESDRDPRSQGIKWFKTPDRNSIEQTEHRNKDTIRFSPTQSEDYECVIESALSDVKRHFKITVIALEAPRIKSVTMTGDSGTQEVFRRVEVVAGEDYEFKCNAESSPTPQTSWTFEGREIMNGDTFKIITSKASDEGSYECIAKNVINATKKSFFVRLMHSPVSDQQKSRKLNFKVGSVAELSCDIYSHPKPVYKWKFNGAEIAQSSTYDIMGNTLRFLVDERHAGTFTCEGSNSMGSHELEFIVNSNEQPPPVVVDQYSPWSEWSSCVGGCDTQGFKERTRTCLAGTCSEVLSDRELCQTKSCWSMLNEWSEWSEWSPCNVTCGYGYKQRTRTCLAGEGKCTESPSGQRFCFEDPCEP